jgi:DNA (cytosine-5)-methyltransferase 1
MPRYSELRSALNIEVANAEDIDLAHFTHYLQTWENGSSHHFRSAAEKFLKEQSAGLNNPLSFKKILPISWDVPFPPKKKSKFKFIDLFAGIGGFRIAFQELGGKCVFSSEWNKFAQQTYHENFGEVPFGDITKVNAKDIPDHDIMLGGFPCQPFSIAGVSKKNSLGRAHGFLDKTQGTLFFDVARIIEKKRPKIFLLENVKNLISHDKKRTFQIIRDTLKKLNYSVYARVLDGQHFVPQHRERIFIIGFDRRVFKDSESFEFPQMPDEQQAIENILEKHPDPKYTLSDKLWEYLQKYAIKHKEKGNGFGFGLTQLDGVARTLSARYYKDGSEILIAQDGKNPRRLTPRECARLQGYPDKFKIEVSDNQAYRQFGNSVVVPLVKAVGKELVKYLTKLPKNGKRSAKGNTVRRKK